MIGEATILVKYSFFSVLLILSGYFLSRFFADKRVRAAQQRAKELTEKTNREVEDRKKEAELSAKDLLIKLRQDFETETRDRREEILSAEKRCQQKEENLEKRVDLLEKKERDISARTAVLHQEEIKNKEQEAKLEQLIGEEKQKLQRISSLTPEEGKKILLSRLGEDLIQEKAIRIKAIEEEIAEATKKKAQYFISNAIQRCASEQTMEATISVVPLPNDEMKGRIIGREGRNIRALETATGVDIIIDDTPEAVMISGFDMIRREIARIALKNLITDGRIHPGRIEEVVEKAKKQIEEIIKEEGENTVFEFGIHNMHPELVKLIGKLKFRTSFGQNALQHTREVAFLIGAIAHDLGMDSKIAIRSGLLHDIGKVVSHNVEEGTHAIIGANLARKYGESPEVVKAIESHHEEVEMNTIYGVLVCAADAISASRPGARAETVETYIKRLENLEKIANLLKGVDKAYALQAGRELRVIVNPEKINDDESIVMARDIRRKIEEEMEYPGHIKVIVVRETRAVEYAK